MHGWIISQMVGIDCTETDKAGDEPEAGAGGNMSEGGISDHSHGGES